MGNGIVILGAGESGVGAALLAKSKGLDVYVSDLGKIQDVFKNELQENGICFEEGGHSQDRVLKASEVIKSPGIPDKSALIIELHKKGIPVISEIEFAGRYSKAFMIGITGSNGKTTTALWCYHILKQAGFDVALAGNVGTSLARTIINRDPAVVVLELSSFQLDGMNKFRCNVGVLTNITPDHLDRYDYIFQNYINAKFRITQNQVKDDVFIFGKDDPVINENLLHFNIQSGQETFSVKRKATAYIDADNLVIVYKNRIVKIPVKDISLSGKHNLYNGMAASIAAIAAGANENDIISGLSNFEGVEHRLENAGTHNGVKFINDSKATNVNSTWYALDCMNQPVIWIAGGVDKGNDYSELFGLVSDKVKALICLGLDNRKLISDFSGKVPTIIESSSMDDTIIQALKIAHPGDVILLSPACASFDLFNNYEHRGRLFKSCVANLKNNPEIKL